MATETRSMFAARSPLNARVEWGWQLDDLSPHKEESEAKSRAEVAELRRFFPGADYRVVSRVVTDWIDS